MLDACFINFTCKQMAGGYGYESNIASSGQFPHGPMGHGGGGGFDPNFINQQYNHGGPQQTQQQQQQHQGHRNSYRRHSDKPVHLDYQVCAFELSLTWPLRDVCPFYLLSR